MGVLRFFYGFLCFFMVDFAQVLGWARCEFTDIYGLFKSFLWFFNGFSMVFLCFSWFFLRIFMVDSWSLDAVTKFYGYSTRVAVKIMVILRLWARWLAR